ncbi:MAG: DUF1697 domain-containing protein [Eudoraea sp.]|nr:DUF1697 domain-containing protein [Eudoraea sp.]MBT8291657.1 DUF1697 domain-containing protein [Eudoraea sp.]
MTKYIALLRGINVGGHKKIIMADLRILFQKLGFSDVASYIQSGNIIFHCHEPDISKLEQQIEQEIENTYGFKVPVIVLAASYLDKIIKDNPFKPFDEGDISKIFYVFLKDVPQKKLVELFNETEFQNERFSIHKDYIYLKCLAGMGKAKLNTNLFEQKLKVRATARNHKTSLKLLELAQS